MSAQRNLVRDLAVGIAACAIWATLVRTLPIAVPPVAADISRLSFGAYLGSLLSSIALGLVFVMDKRVGAIMTFLILGPVAAFAFHSGVSGERLAAFASIAVIGVIPAFIVWPAFKWLARLMDESTEKSRQTILQALMSAGGEASGESLRSLTGFPAGTVKAMLRPFVAEGKIEESESPVGPTWRLSEKTTPGARRARIDRRRAIGSQPTRTPARRRSAPRSP
jgi:hypothetical protein